MITMGLVLLILGLVSGISVLTIIGAVLLTAGIVVWFLGSIGRPVGPRGHYW